MSLDTFTRCLDRVPPETGIHFSGFSEPWQNPGCTPMLVHASRRGHPITVFTTGVGVSRHDVRAIREIPFRKFRVHLPDRRGFPGSAVDAAYLDSIEALVTAGIGELSFVCPGASGPDDVHPAVTHVLRKTGTRLDDANFSPRTLLSRAGAVPPDRGPKPARREGPLRHCPFLRKNVLLPNGDVVLCCMDYGLRHVLGNLLLEDYSVLHSGEEYQRVIVALSDHDLDVICRRCERSRPLDAAGVQAARHGAELRVDTSTR